NNDGSTNQNNQGGNGNGQGKSIKIAGAGSGTGNTVDNITRAEIRAGSTVDAGGAVALNASDDTHITADAGGAAIGISTGGNSKNESGTMVAVGASIAINAIDTKVSAKIIDSSVDAASVALDASSAQQINALTLAGSAAVSTGGDDVFSGAGSGSGNDIDATIEALIDPSTVTTTGDVSVHASDNSSIDADAGTAALAVTTGGQNSSKASAVSVGAAAARNDVNTYTRAAIEHSTVTAGGNVDVQATSTTHIDALTFGFAGSLANSQGGSNALAGAGSGSGNFITKSTEAVIQTSTVDADGSVSVLATDSSAIEALAGAVTLSIAMGSGNGNNVGFGLGLSIGVNEITTGTVALIDDSTVDAGGDVDVSASSSGSIEATGFGVSLTVSQSSQGSAVGLSANVAVTVNTIDSTTRAAIEDSAPLTVNTVTSGGDLTLGAVETGIIHANAVSASLNVAVGGGSGTNVSGGVAVSAAQNTINSTTEALIDGVDSTAANDVSLAASSSKDIDAVVVAASASLTVGTGSGNSLALTGAGAGAGNETHSSVLAIIRDADVEASAGDVSLVATDATTITADVAAAALSASIGTGSGNSASLAVSVSVAINEIDNTTRAVVEQGATVTAGGDFDAHASSTGSIEALG
ncbi:MAG: hypothetical protein JNJ60_12835, partial [Rhodocyclaceae bacterium]|nr:hypothetical protein [Rhodocyclaceae bacterium]